MRRRPVAVLRPPEYPRPVLPADLTEDQQDALLDQMMDALLTGRSDLGPWRMCGSAWSAATSGVPDDDMVEF